MTELTDAIYEGKNFAKVKQLIEKGANVNQGEYISIYHCTDTPLYYAVANGDEFGINCVKLLLEHGAAVDAICGETQETPLCRAVGTGSVELVKLLLEYKANVNHTNRLGETPLHIAVDRSSWQYEERSTEYCNVARVLIENGADINKKSDNGFTPLKRARYYEASNIEQILSDLGAYE